MLHADYEHERFVGDNGDADLAARGYTGNPNLLFFETHADLGGPIVRDRAWFYGFYNHFRIDKAVSGVDRAVATDLGDFDSFGGKATVRLTERDRLIGYTNWGLKEKPKRGLSTDVGPDSVLAQASWSWAHKAEWQRVWDDRTFMTVAGKHFGFGWPMVPQVDPEQHPPRLDTATGRLRGAGWFPGVNGSPPFTFVRWKPQATVRLNHYAPDLGGSHDIKVGYEFQIDSSQFGSNANSGHIRYLDDSTNDRPFHVDRIMLFNMPAEGEISADNRNRHHAVFLQDTWRPADRLSLNLGVRYEQQHTYFLDAVSDPFFTEFFPAGTTAGRTNVIWNTWSPRLGLTFALAPRTVLKGHYGRYHVNLADAHEGANPASTAWIRYAFLDPNANGIYDGPGELGAKLDEQGATGAVPGMQAAYDTLQVAVDRRFNDGFLMQASFDYQWRDEFRAASGESRSPLDADPLVVGSGQHGRIWQNHSLDVAARQATAIWGARLLARYALPAGVGLSANVRHQSGWPYALIQRVDIPGTGTSLPIFLTDLSANRSENVTMVDVRLDKALAAGLRSRVTLMLDVYNLLNTNAVTNFSLRTGDGERVISALDPIAIKLGVRIQF